MGQIYNAAFATGLLIFAVMHECHAIGQWVLINAANAI